MPMNEHQNYGCNSIVVTVSVIGIILIVIVVVIVVAVIVSAGPQTANLQGQHCRLHSERSRQQPAVPPPRLNALSSGERAWGPIQPRASGSKRGGRASGLLIGVPMFFVWPAFSSAQVRARGRPAPLDSKCNLELPRLGFKSRARLHEPKK